VHADLRIPLGPPLRAPGRASPRRRGSVCSLGTVAERYEFERDHVGKIRAPLRVIKLRHSSRGASWRARGSRPSAPPRGSPVPGLRARCCGTAASATLAQGRDLGPFGIAQGSLRNVLYPACQLPRGASLFSCSSAMIRSSNSGTSGLGAATLGGGRSATCESRKRPAAASRCASGFEGAQPHERFFATAHAIHAHPCHLGTRGANAFSSGTSPWAYPAIPAGSRLTLQSVAYPVRKTLEYAGTCASS